MPTRTLKVAVTGAHGTGKTTLVRELIQKFDKTATCTQEAPRLLAEEVCDPTFFRRGANTFTRQCLIIAKQLELEGLAVRSGATTILCDRTIMDHWAYTRNLFPEHIDTPEGSLYESLAMRWAATYDAILYLPPELLPVDDGVREADHGFQRAIDQELTNLYALASVKLIRLSGTLSERTGVAYSTISSMFATM